jgi:hypothetical protein
VIPTSRPLPDGSWTNCLFIEPNQGGGQFAIVDTVDQTANQVLVTAADLNRDTRLDLLTWFPVGGVGVYLSQTSSVAVQTPRFALSFDAPRPNPSRHSVAFEFSLSKNSDGSLAGFDLAGRLVATLAEGNLVAGPHHISWNLRTGNGRPVDAGVYFARLSVGSRQIVRRLEVLP